MTGNDDRLDDGIEARLETFGLWHETRRDGVTAVVRAVCSGGGPSRTPGKVLIEFLVDEGTVRRIGSEWMLTPLDGASS